MKGHFADAADEKYRPISDKLRVVDPLLASGLVQPPETGMLQSGRLAQPHEWNFGSVAKPE